MVVLETCGNFCGRIAGELPWLQGRVRESVIPTGVTRYHLVSVTRRTVTFSFVHRGSLEGVLEIHVWCFKKKSMKKNINGLTKELPVKRHQLMPGGVEHGELPCTVHIHLVDEHRHENGDGGTNHLQPHSACLLDFCLAGRTARSP